jgi:hypothetical protein
VACPAANFLLVTGGAGAVDGKLFLFLKPRNN